VSALAVKCLDARDSECVGEVGSRRSVSGATTATRCERHDRAYRDRVEPLAEETDRRYPDSEFPPAWFDPTYAGESWNPDE
jgi:hypothetical protein